ncbi:hypothetical protein [Rhizobacter fulvus]
MELAEYVTGGVWKVANVTQQPSLTLVEWQVLELPNGNRHFSGWAVENREGRASSVIRTFDASLMKGVTASGRVYQLKGPPGEHSDAIYVWEKWARINSAQSWTDVSVEVWAAGNRGNLTSAI